MGTELSSSPPTDLSNTDPLLACTDAIAAAPDSAAAYVARADLLSRLKAFNEALADYRRALELSPGDISVHLAMSKTNQAKGDFCEAELCCWRALELDSQSAAAWEGLGTVLQTVGRFDESEAALRRALEIQPSGFTSMLLSRMPTLIRGDDERKITELLKNPDLSPRDRASAGFALGDLLDAADRCDEAFAAYASASSLFKQYAASQGEYFDGDNLERKIDEMISTIDPAYFQHRSDFSQPGELPVFIVGMPRSGTSLVEQILASHSKVFGAGELPEMANVRVRLRDMIPPGSPRPIHRHWHRHLAKVHLARLAMMGGDAIRVTDKMPANILHLGIIATMFPGARVIFCDRDIRGTCLSCYFQLFEKFNLIYSYDLADCARQYRLQERLTTHWQEVLPLRMLTVRYAELVQNPEPQIRRLIEFLGLDWEPNCLDFHKTNRPVLTSSLWQVRQPIYRGSVDRWKKYERHLGDVH
jgi:tetratricopeptide (TPR) repeat protein